MYLILPSVQLELQTLKARRVAAFKKNLVELTELQLKHAKVGLCRGAHATSSYFSMKEY